MPTRRHSLGLLVWAAATLLLELTLTRVLSVAQWYHFGFLVISTALLGFGAAGSTLAVWHRLRNESPLDGALAILAALFSVATLGCFVAMQHVPLDPFNVLADWRQWFYSPLYYLLLAAPFYAAGLGFALLFTRGATRIESLYAADLVGAGLGCLVMPAIISAVGGGGSMAIVAALGFLAAAVLASPAHRSASAAATGAALLTTLGATTIARVVPIALTPLKVRPPIQPLETHWNASSRVEVFQLRPPGSPTSFRRFVIDGGTAATGIQDLRVGVRPYLQAHTDDRDYPSGIAYVGVTAPKVLVIGSGGGTEVLDALHYRAGSVTAVEVNPAIVDTVTTRMRDYWGGLFDQPEVHLALDEGRSFLRRSHERFDAIISIHTISNAAVASGAMALSENYVLTREAFQDYLDHLTPDGVLLFSRPEPQLPRIVATAREALASRGVVDAGPHVYAFRVVPDEGEHRMFGVQREAFEADVLIKKTPFRKPDVAQVERIASIGVEGGGPDGVVRERLYSPFASSGGDLYRSITTTRDLDALYRSQPRAIAPATDDRPYFNHLTQWTSLTTTSLRQMTEPQRVGGFMLGDRPVAEVTLILLLMQTALVSAVCILWPLVRLGGITATGGRWSTLAYFAALGFAFIAVEMAVINRLVLFVGQPAYSMTLVLGVLLLSSGLGSALVTSLAPRTRSVWAALAVALLALTFATPSLFSLVLGWPFVARCGVAVAVLAPVGCLMGMPFPLGVRALADHAPALVPWAWGVNGFFTVIGSIVSLMLAMTFGFTATLLVATLCYALAYVTMPRVDA